MIQLLLLSWTAQHSEPKGFKRLWRAMGCIWAIHMYNTFCPNALQATHRKRRNPLACMGV